MKKGSSNGQIMIIVVMVMTSVFVTASLLSSILVRDMKSLRIVFDANRAFYAADSGVEWRMYEIMRNATTTGPVMINGSSCCQIDCGGGIGGPCTPTEQGNSIFFTIKSLGETTSTYDMIIKRGIETNLY
ncbi:MAG: hypothetical protein UX61_C0006G0009 [Parcubacteria group bacterium GW2011_GWA2_46_7]|nr:MAG: hypothetical protein UX14_C0032G0007 [Parcubacteria group bacterium GW2011_GWF1_45_5]KKU44041.1 MAG: hypothetical protein UX61_C0006G0009 [Parcubacteria group bacterium GW2011_GWA2_46_7]KKU47101.1 MAG: hypothetical protein UX66_C0025G0010 [Parcubacteria group bacterium GW2011_GWF2_46_8]